VKAQRRSPRAIVNCRVLIHVYLTGPGQQQRLWTAAASAAFLPQPFCDERGLRSAPSLRTTTKPQISDASKLQGGSRQQAGSGKRQQGCRSPCGEPSRPTNPGSGFNWLAMSVPPARPSSPPSLAPPGRFQGSREDASSIRWSSLAKPRFTIG